MSDCPFGDIPFCFHHKPINSVQKTPAFTANHQPTLMQWNQSISAKHNMHSSIIQMDANQRWVTIEPPIINKSSAMVDSISTDNKLETKKGQQEQKNSNEYQGIL